MKAFNFINFGDKITVFLSYPSADALYFSIDKELYEAIKWPWVIRLSLNVYKSFYLIIRNIEVYEKMIEFAVFIS